MKNAGRSISDITAGEALLYRIRKVHKVQGDPKAGFKPAIELVEIVPNPKRPITAVAELNDDDDRFAQLKPQHAFQPVSLARAIEAGWITEEVFNKLTPSKGAGSDQKEGVHFVDVNLLSPVFNGKRLRVQILESTESNRKGAQVKKNPKTGATVLHMGKPIYRVAQVAYEGENTSRFLESDGTIAQFGSTTTEKMDIKENVSSENVNN